MNDVSRRPQNFPDASPPDPWLEGGAEPSKAFAHPPIPDPACLYGLVGEVAMEGSDGAETNPYAIAGNFMTYFSCAVGRAPFLPVGNTCHHPRLFFLHVGRSGRGRKGDAIALVMRIDEAVRSFEVALAPQIHRGGLSSREGLAALIHDGYRQGQQQIPAVADKRLWVVESEFANVLQQSRRGGNTLSAGLRDCWDGVDLKPATKSNCVHATAPHVCLSGAISPIELLGLVQHRDLLNGFINRFLMIWGERPQIQPFPRRAPQARVDELARRLIEVLVFVRGEANAHSETRPMTFRVPASRRYTQIYRNELNQDTGNGVVDSLLERRAPILLRIAMLLALTDHQWVIDEKHIDAAMAWIKYASDSTMFVFSHSTVPSATAQIAWAAERIADFLSERGSASRRDLIVDCFSRHQPAAVIDAALAHLADVAPGRIRVEVRPRSRGGPGRPATVYHHG